MSRFLHRAAQEEEEHDISKELFLGIMMLMLCLGIMILNVAQPVWRVHQHDPQEGDVVIVYAQGRWGISSDGYTIVERLTEFGFKKKMRELVHEPETDVHLFNRGGSKEMIVRHAAHADSLLSTDQANQKVRTAVYMHSW